MTTNTIPYLRKTKASSQLIVHGEPFLMLGGELQNSSLSNAEYMRTVWPNLKAMNINTILGSVTWEMIEPVEGEFDFTQLDQVIADARSHRLHLVLLWFGSFKNAMSTYVPSWVKQDVGRFPRVHALEAGGVLKTLELVSPFNERAWQADATAFATLMRHLKEIDGKSNTVIMVQVENEPGMLGDSRDRSKIANELIKKPVPRDLILRLQHNNGEDLHPLFRRRFPNIQSVSAGTATWFEAFGTDANADEIFMADAFSRYVEHVAAAGKAEHPIPHYTNAWLNFDGTSVEDSESTENASSTAGGGAKPGVYPSGGPIPHALDVWKHNTPSIDFISPDIYLHDYEDFCRHYRHQNQPLFIPEQRRDEQGARRVMLAYGTYLAIGCAPFGIDTLQAHSSPITRYYGLLNSLNKHILEAQANRPEDIMGFFFDEVDETTSVSKKSWTRTFPSSGFELTISRAFVFGKPGPGSGIIIHQGNGKFLLAGWGFQVAFRSTDPLSTFCGILHSEEKTVDKDGNLCTGRIMNGDETRSGAAYTMPNEEPDYGGFPIAITIPARTGIAECTAYNVREREEDL